MQSQRRDQYQKQQVLQQDQQQKKYSFSGQQQQQQPYSASNRNYSDQTKQPQKPNSLANDYYNNNPNQRNQLDQKLYQQNLHQPQIINTSQSPVSRSYNDRMSSYEENDLNDYYQQNNNNNNYIYKRDQQSQSPPPRRDNQFQQKPYDNQRQSQYPPPQFYQNQSPYQNENNQSRNGGQGIDKLQISEKSKALLFQQKAILEDNMKDLAYMELLSGGLNNNQQKKQGVNVPKVDLSGVTTPQNEPADYQNNMPLYQPQINQSNKPYDALNNQQEQYNSNQRQSKQPVTSPYSQYNPAQQEQNFYYQGSKPYHQQQVPQQQQYQENRPNNNNINNMYSDMVYQNQVEQHEEYELGPGLTPGASKHYEGVKNLYQQEIDILKYNIWQCANQDKRLMPEYDKKEEKMWESFSRSPSPNKDQKGYDEIGANGGGNNNGNERELINEVKNSPNRLLTRMQTCIQKKVQNLRNPENLLKNQVYMILMEQQQQLKTSKQDESKPDGREEYSSQPAANSFYNKSFLGGNNNNVSRVQFSDQNQTPNKQIKKAQLDLEDELGEEYDYEDSEQKQIGIKGVNKQSELVIGSGKKMNNDDMEQLRKENDKLRENLQKNQRNLGASKDMQSNNTLSFQSKEYQNRQQQPASFQNLSSNNPYQNNLYNSALKGQDANYQTSQFIENQQENSQNPAALSPITNKIDMRNLTYEDLINANEDQFIQMKRVEREEQVIDINNMSPYLKLPYYDRMMLIRKEREMNEKNMQNVENFRNNYKKNVLRKKNLGETLVGSRFQTPVKSKTKQNSVAGSSIKLDAVSRVSRSKFKPEASIMRSQIKNDEQFLRKISKYDIDRQTIDFEKLRREKEKERTEENKKQKEVIDNEIETKKQMDIEAKAQKIADLQTIKEKQEKDRKQQLKKNQDQFRKVIEERKASELFLSPNAVSKKPQSNLPNKKQTSNLEMNKSIAGNEKQNWAGSVNVEGTPRAKDASKLPQKEQINKVLQEQF